jgi:Domain of unknown function (DUF4440)
MQLPTESQADTRLSNVIDTDADAIRTTELERLRALAQRDMRTAEQLHADDFQLITPGGSALSKVDYLDRIASGRIAYLVCEPETMDVRMYDDAAVVRYESRLEVRIGGTPDSGRFWHTDVYEQRDGQWKAVWSQATRQA